MATRIRILAISVGTGRIGYVFLVDGKLCDWRLTRKAASSPELAAKYTEVWIDNLGPDVVVTEKVAKHSTKSVKTRALIDAVANVAEERERLSVSVPRISTFSNKYEEAESLGNRFPEIQSWVPKKRRIWETEPRNTVYFEALTFALQVMKTFSSDVPKEDAS